MKRGMVVWEIEVRRGPASSVPVNAGIVPFPENHADARIAHILESCVNVKTVRIRVDMPTVVRIPWSNSSPTMLLWTQ